MKMLPRFSVAVFSPRDDNSTTFTLYRRLLKDGMVKDKDDERPLSNVEIRAIGDWIDDYLDFMNSFEERWLKVEVYLCSLLNITGPAIMRARRTSMMLCSAAPRLPRDCTRMILHMAGFLPKV